MSAFEEHADFVYKQRQPRITRDPRPRSKLAEDRTSVRLSAIVRLGLDLSIRFLQLTA